MSEPYIKAFRYAIENNHIDVISSLVGHININQNVDDSSFLICAVRARNKKIIDILLQRGAKTDAQDADGKTALMYAVQNGDEDIIKAILNKKAEVNASDAQHNTALMYALQRGNKDIADILLEHNAYTDIKDADGNTALIYALQNKDQEIIQTLFRANADVNASDVGGKTALMYAVQNGDEDTVKAILSKKADVNASDKRGNTALMYAVQKGDRDIIHTLLKYNAAVNVNTLEKFINDSELFAPMLKNCNEALDKFLISKVEKLNEEAALSVAKKIFNMSDINFMTFIELKNQPFELINILITNGAKVNIHRTWQNGKTALICAARKQYDEESIKLLIEKTDEECIKYTVSDNQDALYYLLRNDYPCDIVFKCAEKMKEDKQSIINKLLNIKVEYQKTDEVKELLELGADANYISDKEGSTVAKAIVNVINDKNDDTMAILELLIKQGAQYSDYLCDLCNKRADVKRILEDLWRIKIPQPDQPRKIGLEVY